MSRIGPGHPERTTSHPECRVAHRIRRADLATGATTTLAGSGAAGFRDGDSANAQFNHPIGVAIDPSGTFALVTVLTTTSPAAPRAHRVIGLAA